MKTYTVNFFDAAPQSASFNADAMQLDEGWFIFLREGALGRVEVARVWGGGVRFIEVKYGDE